MTKKLRTTEKWLIAAPILSAVIVFGGIRLRERLIVPDFQPRLTIPLSTKEKESHAVLSPDGNLVAVSGGLMNGTPANGRVRVFSASRGTLLYTIKGGNISDKSPLTFSPDSELITGTFDKTSVWDANTGVRLRVLDKAKVEGETYELGSSNDAAYSPDNRTLALSGGFARYWNARTGQFQGFIDGMKYKPARSMAEVRPHHLHGQFSPDGKILACIIRYQKVSGMPAAHNGNWKIQLWSVAKRRLLRTLPISPVMGFAWSRDSKKLILLRNDYKNKRYDVHCYSKDGILIWQRQHPKVTSSDGKEYDFYVEQAAWSPDGRWLVFSNPYWFQLLICETKTGKPRLTLKSPLVGSNIDFRNVLNFSADGKTLLSPGRDHLHLWNFEKIARYLEQTPL